MTLYNTIGRNYNHTRKPDQRIVDRLIALLDLPANSIVADVGAGTGNYSNEIASRDFQIIAIEPSAIMQEQKVFHPRVKWLTASAEKIPLADNAVDGAIVMLALPIFKILRKELKR